MKKEDLAIYNYREEILEAVKGNRVVVIEAPTGSGKTTQIPQILFYGGAVVRDIIGVTQPRRIAAYSVSKRIASEMNHPIGALVGYKIRFEDVTSQNTQIKIMTDGILLEELRNDPLLKKYSIMIVDEAHERSLNIDFILGLLKEILAIREDFKVIISSATINAKLFSSYFNNAPVISIETKPYPIEIKYRPLNKKMDYEEMLQEIDDIVREIEISKEDGDILIFLAGEDAIKACIKRLAAINSELKGNFALLPLYARLSPEEQEKVFDEFPGKRKIIVSTNIAETSITIENIKFVIDSGLSKINYYNPRTLTSYLELKPISKASCNQRTGRTGRTGPGTVYRLYSKIDYESREDFTKAEIYRKDLSEVILRMADLGIKNYQKFKFISQPNEGAISSAIDTLKTIDALDKYNTLTSIGKSMVDFPLLPRLARILIEAILNHKSVVNAVLIIISFLSAKHPFLYQQGEEIESRNAQKKLRSKNGDFFSWINIFFKYISNKSDEGREKFAKTYYLDKRAMNEIVNVHSQLTSILVSKNVEIGYELSYEEITLSLCSGLKQYLCYKDPKRKNTYTSIKEDGIRIHPGSYLFGIDPEWLIGYEIVNTGRTYVRAASIVTKEIVKKYYPMYFDISQGKKPQKGFKSEATSIKREKSAEDFNNITIINKHFQITKENHERIIRLPYREIMEFAGRKKELIDGNYGNIKALLIYENIVILKDRLGQLVYYFDHIDFSSGILKSVPKETIVNYPEDWNNLIINISNLSKPTFSRKRRSVMFLTLVLLEKNKYEFCLKKDFFESVTENINAIENLFESNVPVWSESERETLEMIYSKLSNILKDID